MLPRTLEPEVMSDRDEAECYDKMDHAAVNRGFVDDLLAPGEFGSDVCDLGTGTALIPVELCSRRPDIRVMAVDASSAMLDLAVYRIEVAAMRQRIHLCQARVGALPFEDAFFDAVISNSLVHHLSEPALFFADCRRIGRGGALIFVRDLLRPSSAEEVEQLVALHAANEPPQAQQLFRQSLHASLTLPEVQQLIEAAGLSAANLHASSDRHWTWSCRIESPTARTVLESGMRS